MPRRLESQTITGPAGALEALLEEPADEAPREAAILCHPHPAYGGSMHNRVVYRMAHGLRRAGLAVLRFNFRGVGLSEGEYGHFEGEIEDARAALAWMRARYPDLPFLLAGFSFGARVITRLGCADGDATTLIAAGFPTKNWNAAYLEECRASKVFIQSRNDEYGPREDLEALFARVPGPKKLIWIESQDHFFAGGLEELEERVRETAQNRSGVAADAEQRLTSPSFSYAAVDLRYPIGPYSPLSTIRRAERDAWIAELEALAGNLRDAVKGLSGDQLDKPYRPGGWTVRQVVHHIPDAHMSAYMFVRLALTEEAPTIKPIEEAAWAELPDAKSGPIEPSLALTDALHRRWVMLFRSLSDDDFKRSYRHPFRGELVALDRTLGYFAWHSRHHVAQILTLRKREGW